MPVVPAPTAAATPTPVAVLASPTPAATPPATASPVASVTGTGPTHSPSAFPLVGQPSPPLVAPGLDGATIDLAAYRANPVWIVFTAADVPLSRAEFPLMNGFATRYADTGLTIVAVDIREDEATVAAFAESLNARFPVALDPDGTAQRAWGAFALPVHFWIDADGIVRAGALGGIGPDLMATSLQKILPGDDRP